MFFIHSFIHFWLIEFKSKVFVFYFLNFHNDLCMKHWKFIFSLNKFAFFGRLFPLFSFSNHHHNTIWIHHQAEFNRNGSLFLFHCGNIFFLLLSFPFPFNTIYSGIHSSSWNYCRHPKKKCCSHISYHTHTKRMGQKKIRNSKCKNDDDDGEEAIK